LKDTDRNEGPEAVSPKFPWSCSVASLPSLPELYVTGFDAEQVWQQMDVIHGPLLETLNHCMEALSAALSGEAGRVALADSEEGLSLAEESGEEEDEEAYEEGDETEGDEHDADHSGDQDVDDDGDDAGLSDEVDLDADDLDDSMDAMGKEERKTEKLM
jgi:hypothetical protein